jgi:tetratricopeptide (TPR) repeat protein
MPARIFISYRREDAAGDAGRLADHLHRRFGKTHVFLDIDTIDPGVDFVRVLHASLQETAAVLVVIGPRWTSLRDAGGTRRLESPDDFVRLEVEAALGRNIPVVPVLVQGAPMPREADLPASLAPLATRQAAALDHAEFHDDAERLCDRLESVIAVNAPASRSLIRRWWPAAAVVAMLALGLIGYIGARSTGEDRATTGIEADAQAAAIKAKALEQSRLAETLVAEGSAQRRRNQLVEALTTLARARELAPDSAAVREAQEDVAMDWIRNVRVESGTSSFGEAIEPALAVIDTSLPSATGTRRADLLAHTGWATFLLRRDGDRRLTPTDAYQEALSLDPGNPYANAMLAHWVLLQDDDVPRAVKLFETAVEAGRGLDAVRILQWAGYGNVSNSDADAERVRLADAMRRGGEKLNTFQAQALWGPYYLAMPAARERQREALLGALAPDEHISTLGWAFDEYAAEDDSRRQTIRYYVALLHATAGRVDQAAGDLRTLNKELAASPGSLRDAVQAALKRLRAGRLGSP